MGKEVFSVELSRIKDEKIRKSTEMLLDMLPAYFYRVPASSSGMYHPSFSLGEGGLARHVKAAMRILEEVFKDNVFGEFDDHRKDLMRMALLLHDGLKFGMTNSGHTCIDHPVLMSNFIMENSSKLFIDELDAYCVARLILTHMGPWNKDKDGNEVMPVPVLEAEKVIHFCDYIASRNFIEMHFENGEIVDSVDRGRTRKLV